MTRSGIGLVLELLNFDGHCEVAVLCWVDHPLELELLLSSFVVIVLRHRIDISEDECDSLVVSVL